MGPETKRRLRLGSALPALALAAYLLYQSRWVVDRLQDSDRDSPVLVYLGFGAVACIPALLLLLWAGRVFARRGR